MKVPTTLSARLDTAGVDASVVVETVDVDVSAVGRLRSAVGDVGPPDSLQFANVSAKIIPIGNELSLRDVCDVFDMVNSPCSIVLICCLFAFMTRETFAREFINTCEGDHIFEKKAQLPQINSCQSYETRRGFPLAVIIWFLESEIGKTQKVIWLKSPSNPE